MKEETGNIGKIEILVAEHSGFCFGVKCAIDKAEELIRQNEGCEKNLYSLGPLIHNGLVTDQLEERGLKIIDDLSLAKEGDTVLIRSHGAPPRVFLDGENRKINVFDATCPFVKKIQTLVDKAYSEGKQVVIAGDKTHPEVIGINGWCQDQGIIIGSVEEAEKVKGEKLFLVCQTTINQELAQKIITVLTENNPTIEVQNTICSATEQRQNSCKELSQICDAMIVVGGKNSSNSKKLYMIAQNYCKKAFFIEKIRDLPLHRLSKCTKIGVAAGASTPECVIKEVIAAMSENITEMNMMDLMDDIDKSLRLPRLGEIVNGKVHQVTEKEVIVNMGCKKDGVIPKEEVTLEGDQKLTDLFKEGDDIQAKVVKTDDGDGVIVLSKKKLELNANFEEINEALENKSILNVKVVRAVNGGVIAAYKEVSGFIPLSQLSDKFVENADEFIGQEMDVKVSRVDPKRGRVVFSHKVVLAEEKQKQLEEAWARLNVGEIVEGTVMRFTDYGAFIDLGGIDGLLHISEISWGKLKHPKEVLEIGDKVKVKILSMNDEKGKISLGLKQTTPEPWSVIGDKYQIGQVVTGNVVQIKEYGAFVELEPGLDGLVHISEVAHKRVNNIADEISVGQTVNAKILDIDTERKRISLSIKQTMDPPEVEEDSEEREEADEPAVEPVDEVVEKAAEASEEVVSDAAAEDAEVVMESTEEE